MAVLVLRFASFLSGGFTTMAVMNPPEKKLEKCTSVHLAILYFKVTNISMFGTIKSKSLCVLLIKMSHFSGLYGIWKF